MEGSCSINLWINEGRDKALQQLGLANLAKEVLAGMKVLRIYCTEEQKDKIVKRYPIAKYDSATTKSIELLPAEIKNELFDLVIKNKSLDIIDSFLKD